MAALGGDVGDTVYTEQAQDCVTDSSHEAGRARSPCPAGVLFQVNVPRGQSGCPDVAFFGRS
jgi:hypothetical protein